jgi:hypothetical protein
MTQTPQEERGLSNQLLILIYFSKENQMASGAGMLPIDLVSEQKGKSGHSSGSMDRFDTGFRIVYYSKYRLNEAG